MRKKQKEKVEKKSGINSTKKYTLTVIKPERKTMSIKRVAEK